MDPPETNAPQLDDKDHLRPLPSGPSPGVYHSATMPAPYPAQPSIPDYLKNTYSWAYLRPKSVQLLDRHIVVNSILWGNYNRLARAAISEMVPGQKVFQPACVYGNLSLQIAEFLGPKGHLDIGDIAPVQVENCKRKTADCANTTVHLHDAREAYTSEVDLICCFFLLHEIPEVAKHQVVERLLDAVPACGKVVFVDYHRPHPAHPLKWLMRFVNGLLEPFAKALWQNEISSYASQPSRFSWSKETYFGGLYQKVVATRNNGPNQTKPRS